MKSKEKAVTGLTKGIEFLFKKNKVSVEPGTFLFSLAQVSYVKGHGKLAGPNQVNVDTTDGKKESIKTKNVLIATGSEPTPFPGLTVSKHFRWLIDMQD